MLETTLERFIRDKGVEEEAEGVEWGRGEDLV